MEKMIRPEEVPEVVSVHDYNNWGLMSMRTDNEEFRFIRGVPVAHYLLEGLRTEQAEALEVFDPTSGYSRLAVVNGIARALPETGRINHAHELGDMMWYITRLLEWHGSSIFEVADDIAQRLGGQESNGTFEQIDKLCREAPLRQCVMADGTTLDIRNHTSKLLTTVFEEFCDSCEACTFDPFQPTLRGELVRTAGTLFECIAWIAQERLGVGLSFIARQNLYKVSVRNWKGLASVFGRGDKIDR